MKPAILVVDIQNDSFNLNTTAKQSLDRAIKLINLSTAQFRDKGFPVIVIQHINEEQGLKPGNPDYDLPPSLNILENDIHIQKKYGNAFTHTDLHTILQKHEVDTVFITGFCAELCILSTYRGAEDLNLTPLLIRGATASGNLENLNFVESIHNIVTYDALKILIK